MRKGMLPTPGGFASRGLTKRNASRSIFFSPGFMEIKDFQDTGLRPRVSLPYREEGKEKADGREPHILLRQQRVSPALPRA